LVLVRYVILNILLTVNSDQTLRRPIESTVTSGDPLKGEELSWARIDGNTMTVFLMTVSKQGVYELQQYDRTLSGTGMRLLFRSWRDGDRLRSVLGRLVKNC